MRIKLFKITPLIIFFCLGIYRISNVSAGGGFSKPTSQVDTQKMAIIQQPKYYPHISPDGGKAYFGAWNGLHQ